MLVRWYPFSGIRRYGHLFDDRLYRSSPDSFMGWGEYNPRADFSESDEEFKIVLELPGIGKEDFNISVHNGVLTISGEKKVENSENNGHKYRLYERYSGSFHRTFELPENVNEDGIKAEYKDGLLTVNLPKSEKAKAREITVKVGK